ncbi:helix-turn-helix domain-containing protein [Myroides sp. LoEW2-1]|uniref:helix-turn-helix domain-containing protein n=1 Tax=Myroides sp. LoEW2-1 TaxID=2683192 RepID=UPI0013257EF3|nr:helix-turn-helix transcriptional regulator [Myroides sp. LoEW2-1]MVX36213.1 helix-turn-helix domain-containing protein [Myroides sp. LoEW2-1]
MSYKKLIGKKLRSKRDSLNLTKENIVDLTGVSKSSISKVENGTAKDIDFYVKYAKAVDYALSELMDVSLNSVTIYKLKADLKQKVNLTAKVRKLVVSKYFADYRTVAEIKEKMQSDKLIDVSVTSGAISNVLNNLRKEGIVVSISNGRKNLYKRK